jgi:hypothetical protein
LGIMRGSGLNGDWPRIESDSAHQGITDFGGMYRSGWILRHSRSRLVPRFLLRRSTAEWVLTRFTPMI